MICGLFRALLGASLVGLMLALASAAESPGPQVSVSLRGVADESLTQGEPWRVFVRLDRPRGSQQTFLLAPATGTWADAVEVALYPANGATPVARASAVGKPEAATARLDHAHVAGGIWRFSPEVMATVAPGAYRLLVWVKIERGTGWVGVAESDEIPLTVVPASPEPSATTLVNRAQDLLLLDQLQPAAATVDAALKRTPRDDALLRVRALIAEKAGNPYAALLCLNAARLASPDLPTRQPPVEDGAMLARLEKQRATVTAAPPTWTWPPTEVVTALAQDPKTFPFFPALPPERAAGGSPIAAAPPAVQPTAAAPAPSPAPILPASSPAPSTPSPAATPAPTVPSGPAPGSLVPAADLNDAAIAADSAGQWAAGASAGSQYTSPNYAADKMTGAPDVPQPGDHVNAWCPAKSTGMEWCQVTFAQPVFATEVRVRQTNAPGSIIKVEAIATDGVTHVWWEGTDPAKPPTTAHLAWFAVRVPRTPYRVTAIRLTLNLESTAGWEEIDAVQLVGARE